LKTKFRKTLNGGNVTLRLLLIFGSPTLNIISRTLNGGWTAPTLPAQERAIESDVRLLHNHNVTVKKSALQQTRNDYWHAICFCLISPRRHRWVHLAAVGRLREGSHKIQFLPLLVGVDGCTLIVIHQLIQRMELALPNAIQRPFHMNPEVLVASRSLQWYRVVTHLKHMWSLHTVVFYLAIQYHLTGVTNTHICFTVSDEEVTIMAMLI